MSSWLSSLPHQIPFRAASDARLVDDSTIEGTFLCSASDALYEAPPARLQFLLVEAMAQIGGTLAFRESKAPGFLSAIDEARFHHPIEVGDRVTLRVTLQATFERIFRFEGTATVGEVECARARFYLAAGN